MDKGYVEKALNFYSFKRPSFMEGMARIFDWRGRMHLVRVPKDGQKADRLALKSDWDMLGRDFREVIGSYGPNKRTGRERTAGK